MESKTNSNSSGLIVTLIVIGSIGTALTVGVFSYYFSHFNGPPTHDHTHWGVFGDFIGGTLNPVLSFFGLIALLITVALQQKELSNSSKELKRSADALKESQKASKAQLKHLRESAQKDELFRMIDYVFKGTMGRFSPKAERVYVCYDRGRRPIPLSNKIHLCSLIGTEKQIDFYDRFISNSELRPNERIKMEWIDLIIPEIYELKYYLEEYDKYEGGINVTRYYRKRMRQICEDLYNKGYLEKNVYEYFGRGFLIAFGKIVPIKLDE